VEVGGVEADFDCLATAVDSRGASNEEFDSNDEDDGENSDDHDGDDDNDKADDNIDDNDDDNDGGDDVDEDDDDSNDVDGDEVDDDNDDIDEYNVDNDDSVDNDLSELRCSTVEVKTCAVLLTFMLGVAEISLSVSDVSMDFPATDDVISKSNDVISPFVCDVARSRLLIRDAERAFISQASVVENSGFDSNVDFNIDMSVNFDVMSVKNVVIFVFVYHDIMPASASMDLGSDTIPWACEVEIAALDASVTFSIGVSVLDIIFL